jgi:hypothetical protein
MVKSHIETTINIMAKIATKIRLVARALSATKKITSKMFKRQTRDDSLLEFAPKTGP